VKEQGLKGGFIVRTVAEGVSSEDIAGDIPFLQKLWADLSAKIPKVNVPTVIYQDMPLYLRALRDLARAPIDRIRVDSRLTWTQMVAFATSYYPQLIPLIECYTGE